MPAFKCKGEWERKVKKKKRTGKEYVEYTENAHNPEEIWKKLEYPVN